MSRGFSVLVCLAVFVHSGLTMFGTQIITSA